MSDTHSDENRLSGEKSPYLQQHAKDPVNWQPWDEKALGKAKERDIPIFLSIGYSACHWCHVMQEESFQDEEVASILNENFVPIKVDREERPDLDRIYQEICQRITGRGGWPLSVWLTPEQKPFYIGTYFPRNPKHGQKGLIDILEKMVNQWENNRRELVERAQKWTDSLGEEGGKEPLEEFEPSGEDPLIEAADRIFEKADLENGGFGKSGPKFPQPLSIEILLNANFLSERTEFKKVAFRTLDSMMEGGIFDHLGGGFHRYSTDPKWRVPHFEKMLYDNALLPIVYLYGYQTAKKKGYIETVERTFEFAENEMTSPEGGFYSSLGARSEGEEGKFYIWSPDEIRDTIGDSTYASIFMDRFGISEGGNFEGKNVLIISKSLDRLAKKYDIRETELKDILEDAKNQVMKARSERTRPPRDEKILAGWNGLMISALAKAAPILGKKYEKSAERALNFVKNSLWVGEENELCRRYKDGERAVHGFLKDYAYLAQGSFDLYQITGEVEYLKFSLDLCRSIENKFWDEKGKSLYFTPSEAGELITRPQELTDLSTPSSTGVSARILSTLSHMFPGEGFDEIVKETLKARKSEIRANPLAYSSLVLADDQYRKGPLEITIVADEIPEEWNSKLAETFIPNGVKFPRPSSAKGVEKWLETLEVPEIPEVWKNRGAENGGETLYICGKGTCSQPIKDIDEGLDWIEKLSPG